jgi:hypothetical protein
MVTVAGTIARNKNKGKTIIDWDLNVFSPEQWYGPEKGSYWDPELWMINARIYSDGIAIDTDYTLTLLPKEADAIGLVDFAKQSADSDVVGLVHDDWLDGGLDGFIDLYHFNEMYRTRLSDRVIEFLDTLPRYIEDVPARMRY